MSNWSYRPELDGLRCLAVYLVLLFHTRMTWAEGGFIGVDLFFVLSGFLVSQVIFSEVDERGTFSLGRFYSRRVRRLLPAAVVVIIVTALVQLLVASQTQRLTQIADARAALTYLANWQFIADSRDYFAIDTTESPFIHFWSLSIEEQFYIAFPLVILVVLRFARRPMRLLAVVMSSILLMSLALQFWHAVDDATYAYYATETRLYQLAAGVVLALIARRRPGTAARRAATRTDLRGPLWGAIALGGVAALLLLGSGVIDISPSLRGVLATGAATAAIGGLYAGPHTAIARIFAMSWPRYLGQISYGTYLWHWPVLLVTQQLFNVRPMVVAVLGAAVATGLAALSAQLLENPIRSVRLPESYRWPVVSAGLTLSLLAAAFVVPPLLESARRPAVSGGTDSGTIALVDDGVKRLNRPVPGNIDLKAAFEDRPRRVPLCTPEDIDACELVSGDGSHVMVVGDSHAQMFQGAMASIARDHGFRLSASVVKGCPWQEGLLNMSASEADQDYCREARQTFYHDVLPEMDVDVVVAISMSRSDKMWEERLQADGDAPEGEDLLQRQFRTAQATSGVIRAAGADLIIVKSVMGTAGYDRAGWDPLDCLSRAKTLAECAVVPEMVKPALDGLYDAIATTTPGVATVDLNPILCPDPPLCAPVVDDTVVWKDPDHVTHTYLDEHRGAIFQRLRRTGLFE